MGFQVSFFKFFLSQWKCAYDKLYRSFFQVGHLVGSVTCKYSFLPHFICRGVILDSMTAKCISHIMTNKDKFCIHTKDDSHDKFATVLFVNLTVYLHFIYRQCMKITDNVERSVIFFKIYTKTLIKMSPMSRFMRSFRDCPSTVRFTIHCRSCI